MNVASNRKIPLRLARILGILLWVPCIIARIFVSFWSSFAIWRFFIQIGIDKQDTNMKIGVITIGTIWNFSLSEYPSISLLNSPVHVMPNTLKIVPVVYITLVNLWVHVSALVVDLAADCVDFQYLLRTATTVLNVKDIFDWMTNVRNVPRIRVYC